jgi:hypothetical protein
MAAKSFARAQSVSIGKALSQLARKGLVNESRKKTRNGIPVFKTGKDASPVTPEQVNAIEDEL